MRQQSADLSNRFLEMGGSLVRISLDKPAQNKDNLFC